MCPGLIAIKRKENILPIVEVFKTNVENPGDAEIIMGELTLLFPSSEINFDLEDCDKILRIVGPTESAELVPFVLKEMGFHCEVLHD